LAYKHEHIAVKAILSQQALWETLSVTYVCVISPSMARLISYDMNSGRLTEDVIPTIFVKQHNAKPKRISRLMRKLNRKGVCMSDNRVILRANDWTFTSF